MIAMSKLERLIEYELGINDLRAIRSPNREDSTSRYFKNIILKNLFNITEIASLCLTVYAALQGDDEIRDYVTIASGFTYIGTTEIAKFLFTSITRYPKNSKESALRDVS